MIPNANMELCEYDHNVYVNAILSSLILTSASLREHIDNNMWMQGIQRHSKPSTQFSCEPIRCSEKQSQFKKMLTK